MIFLDKLDSTIADLPNFRKQQIYRAIFKSAYGSWDEVTSLPLGLRAQLSDTIPLAIDSKLIFSGDEKTVKALIRLDDSQYIETVLMKSNNKRNTICVSTQVGCPMKCAFCASAKSGFTRNLSMGEIVAQILLFSRFLKSDDAKVTNIVFMGIGEPLLNYENVIGAVRLLNQESTLNLSPRRFSISTSGILPGIERLAKEPGLEVNLAISLNAAIDKKRDSLMPVNKRYPLKRLSKALKKYFESTKRKIMIEYMLVKDTNTFKEDAVALRHFINDTEAAYVVNLIPMNDADCGFEALSKDEIFVFRDYLKRCKISFFQRAPFGEDIGAACGQLATKEHI